MKTKKRMRKSGEIVGRRRNLEKQKDTRKVMNKENKRKAKKKRERKEEERNNE